MYDTSDRRLGITGLMALGIKPKRELKLKKQKRSLL